MKYNPLKILFFVTLMFCIILFIFNLYITKKEDKDLHNDFNEKSVIEYKANQTIRVRMTKTGEIVAMDINDYLRGVVPSEMPPSYNIEALKAQALVARTYTYMKMMEKGEGDDADICDNFAHCQAFYEKEKLFQIWRNRGFSEALIREYWEKINEAVVSTQNQVIMHDGQLIKAFFHASSPYKTENVDQIWGHTSYPYLVSVDNKEKEDYENRTSKVEIDFSEIISKIHDEINADISVDDCKSICVNEYTTSGRVKNIKVKDFVISAEKLRVIFGLKSTDFYIETTENSVIFNVTGYGHGVGMSQVGAETYANEGYNYIDIIKHYYTGVEIKKLDEK